jgi:hypothetical protein
MATFGLGLTSDRSTPHFPSPAWTTEKNEPKLPLRWPVLEILIQVCRYRGPQHSILPPDAKAQKVPAHLRDVKIRVTDLCKAELGVKVPRIWRRDNRARDAFRIDTLQAPSHKQGPDTALLRGRVYVEMP